MATLDLATLGDIELATLNSGWARLGSVGLGKAGLGWKGFSGAGLGTSIRAVVHENWSA